MPDPLGLDKIQNESRIFGSGDDTNHTAARGLQNRRQKVAGNRCQTLWDSTKYKMKVQFLAPAMPPTILQPGGLIMGGSYNGQGLIMAQWSYNTGYKPILRFRWL